jgi:hypothetical protein
MYENPQIYGTVIRVGDEILSEWGETTITKLTVCPVPTKDPAGEETGIEVEEVEPSWVACTADLANGHWVYGKDITARKRPDA